MALVSHDTLDTPRLRTIDISVVDLVPDPIDIGPYRKIRLKPNKRGYWEVWWAERAADGDYATQHASSRTKVLAEAETYLGDFCRNVRQNIASVAQPQVPTIDALCVGWLNAVAPLGQDKNNGYSLVSPRRLLGYLTADQLDEKVLQDYRKQRPVKDGTVRRELSALRTVLNWATEQRPRLIHRDDIPVFNEKVMPPEGAPRVVFLDETQESLVWDQAIAYGAAGDDVGYRVMLYVCLGLETAARNGALMELTWDRVNMKLGMIDYRNPLRRVTKKKRVQVAMSNRLRPVIEAARAKAIAEGRVDARGEPTGRVIWDVKCIDGPFDTFFAGLTLNLPGKMTAHVMRHTWCSLHAMAGMPLQDIAKFVGDNHGTIEKYYLHLTPEHMHAIANFGRKD